MRQRPVAADPQAYRPARTRPVAGDPLDRNLGRGRSAGLVPHDGQPAGVMDTAGQAAQFPGQQGRVRGRGGAGGSAILAGSRRATRTIAARAHRDRAGQHPALAAGAIPGAVDRAAVGDGHRQLASAALDAAGAARASRGSARRRGLRGQRRRCRAARAGRATACRRRCRHGRRAAARQLREFRRRPARQLPVDTADRPAALCRRSARLRAGAARARRAGRRGAPSGRVRPARAQPAAGRARADEPARAERSPHQDRLARPLSADAHHVARMRVGPRLRQPRGARGRRGAGAARGAGGAARQRRGAGAVRRAGVVGGGVCRRHRPAQLHVRRLVGEGRSARRAGLRARAAQRGGAGLSGGPAGDAHVPRQLEHRREQGDDGRLRAAGGDAGRARGRHAVPRTLHAARGRDGGAAAPARSPAHRGGPLQPEARACRIARGGAGQGRNGDRAVRCPARAVQSRLRLRDLRRRAGEQRPDRRGQAARAGGGLAAAARAARRLAEGEGGRLEPARRLNADGRYRAR
ncbi:hypothetical protein BGLA2_2320007 [Burkholderia gladioli]|nr:hypothetical protein BGLA2_2320007 [Burkholderia gladioli]